MKVETIKAGSVRGGSRAHRWVARQRREMRARAVANNATERGIDQWPVKLIQ